MNPLFYTARFIYHLRYWLLCLPIAVAILIAWSTRHQTLQYSVETSIYTGVISGENTIVNDPESSMSSVQNAKMENMITIITSASTLQRVSIKLFAMNMIYGNPDEDNTYIKASTFRELEMNTPEDVKKLIDKSSVDQTIKNLTEYSQKDPDNYVYGLFNWQHRHYSYAALSKITAKRIGFSEILKINYSADDPGIAYNTLKILNEIFVDQYNSLRFAGSSDVIRFFNEELKKQGGSLQKSEDELTEYNIKNKIINYGEQTKQVAAMDRDFTLQYEDNNLKYYASKKLVESLEKQVGDNAQILKTNNEFLNKLQKISDLTFLKTEAESLSKDSVKEKKGIIANYSKKLENAENDFKGFVDLYYNEKYSKDGYPNEEIVQEWLAELLKLEGYTAQKNVLESWRKDLDSQYSYYSPIGAVLKRKEREINFTEASYLSILNGLHDAMLRQKSMEMMGATIKVVTPPSFPLSAMPTKRKATIAAAYFGSLFFVLFFFIIVESLDQTLRDKLRTEKITGLKVIGAFPAYTCLKYKEYEEQQKKIAAQQLGSTISYYFEEGSPQIINLLSIEPQEGKSELSHYLSEYWRSQGLTVKQVDWKIDFKTKSRELILGKSLKELINIENEDIILVEYAPLENQPISSNLADEATLNLLITRADRTWKETDRVTLSNLTDRLANKQIVIGLNNARLSVVEGFTGLLPPYPKLRKMGYRFLHLGLTSKEKIT